MTARLSAATLLAALALAPTPVRAAPITFTFSGAVTSVTDPLGIFNGTYAVGQPVAGSYTFTSTPDIVEGFSPGVQFHSWPGPPFGFKDQGVGFNVTSNGRTLTYDPTIVGFFFQPFQVNLFNDQLPFPPIEAGDTYVAGGQFAFPSFFNAPPGDFSPAFFLQLTDPTGTALSGVDLPLTPDVLARFGGREGLITIYDPFAIPGIDPPLAEVRFSVGAIHATPEPASLAVFGGLLVAAGWVVRRRKV